MAGLARFLCALRTCFKHTNVDRDHQCTDISILPKNGTPPFTLTIAPSLHPPFNITSNTMSAINWTVVLSWASPFFISLVDSVGNTWANGPLHSGQGTSSKCLDVDTASSTAKKSFPTAAVAAGLGAGIGGILLGILISYLFALYQEKREEGTENIMMFGRQGKLNSPLDGGAADSYYASVPSGPSHRPLPGSLSDNTLVNRYGRQDGLGQYQLEPFVIDGEEGYRDPQHPTSSTASASGPAPSVSHHSEPGSQAPMSPQQQVYVVHHDGGRPPVTVYTGGAEFVELPPMYAEGSNPISQRRRPSATPAKGTGLTVR